MLASIFISKLLNIFKPWIAVCTMEVQMKILRTVVFGFALASLLVSGCSGTDDGPCAGIYCGDHGTCDSSTDTCQCDSKYTGAGCDFCAEGYHFVSGECLADACSFDADCDDGVACNGKESCVVGGCLAGTQIQCQQHSSCKEPDGSCECDEGFILQGEACIEGACTMDSDCDDGLFCNGEEECIDGSCASQPFDCMENGHCDESTQACVCDEGYSMEQDQCFAMLEIKGNWIDDWGSFHDISQEQWTIDDSLFSIKSIDVSGEFLVAQNDEDNQWSPSLWSRFDWTWDEAGHLLYCQIAYAAATEQQAASSDSADRSDLTTGCAGFGWSKLNERLEIIDIWEDPWGFEQNVTQAQWTTGDSVFHTSQFDNVEKFLVAHNDANNQWSPDKWSRFDWTWDEMGQLYYCQIAFDKESEQDALAAREANRQDLDTGCAGFSWSALHTRPAIVGNWVDDWGYGQEITREAWTSGEAVFHITRINNRSGYLVTHNDPDNQWSPGLWSRFDWAWDNTGQLYYCQIVFDAKSAGEAEANKNADATDIQAGCAGFGWSHLSVAD